MMNKHVTIGMAGHIDHGKTSLTKALTNIETDTLKEEKEREISIELGFAPFFQSNEMNISIIDVPGHEKFIKKMIAGVSGIDMMILVVAADEGVMPQTKEHLAILDFLRISSGMVVLTKCGLVESGFLDIVKEDINRELAGSIFQSAAIFEVDSLTGEGIEALKQAIIVHAQELPFKQNDGPFRLPVDSAFTIKGQGTVVRGTVNEGSLREGEAVYLLPSGAESKARQIQVHNKKASYVCAGQRAAVNLPTIAVDQVKRGDVLVASLSFPISDCLDVSLSIVRGVIRIKQRMQVACYIGTAEVMGKIVFFDRKEAGSSKGDILCQLRLEKKVVAKRGDAFIIRRPSPPETIGGGWIVDPHGGKYKFGQETMCGLQRKKEGSEVERLRDILKQKGSASVEELSLYSSLPVERIRPLIKDDDFFLEYEKNHFAGVHFVEEVQAGIVEAIEAYHVQNPMKQGMPGAELMQKLSPKGSAVFIRFMLENGAGDGIWENNGQLLFLSGFAPHIPDKWRTKVGHMLDEMKNDGMKVTYLNVYAERQNIPEPIFFELKPFLAESGILIPLTDVYYVVRDSFEQSIKELKEQTGNSFTIAEAKQILGLTRKHMIPLLELLDAEKITVRKDNRREWST
ncbi:selenocysteine-specific translation elongation factor [Bacillus sp. 1P06AnD]|uniref:selenocysteine-specific translation elongation factor n=1 Tax=Bacillus sp. 1P06AnD TaxID=3132208 RepID=UPI00399FDB2B